MTGTPLYLGFDLSTQQIKAVAVDAHLAQHYQYHVEFDVDTPSYGVSKGVFKNPVDNSVYAPVRMWFEALDVLFSRMEKDGFPFKDVRAISGACQQHGSVYWSYEANDILDKLDPDKSLADQLYYPNVLSHEYAPNWQDHSTAKECQLFEEKVGGSQKLADITGSKAHHRFTGPQIMKFKNQNPKEYEKTSRISLVSSFLSSVFLGKIAPFDVSDVCGMNLWNINDQKWDDSLIELVAGSSDANEKEKLLSKLGPVEKNGGAILGNISNYWVSKYNFDSKNCKVSTFTGDNPSTILSLPLEKDDLMISLGTSTTVLITTENLVPSDLYHVFTHPTTNNLFMGMLCYCNGSLARENVRNELNQIELKKNPNSKNLIKDKYNWDIFNKLAESNPPLGQVNSNDPIKIGVYFPLAEIIPDCQAQTLRYEYDIKNKDLSDKIDNWNLPYDDPRAIVESQALSMRMRSGPMIADIDNPTKLKRPHRVFFVGGASRNLSICRVMSQVFGPTHGSFKIEIADACATGAAYKAAWVDQQEKYKTFQDMTKEEFDWDRNGLLEKVNGDLEEEVVARDWERYQPGVDALKLAEDKLVV